MWPLTIVPPCCREAWIVTTADKWCSFLETLHMHKGHGAVLTQRESREEEDKFSHKLLQEQKVGVNKSGAFI